MTTLNEEMTQRISDVLELDSRTEKFSNVIQDLDAPHGVLRFLNDFVDYNAVFAGGVSMLAGRIHFASSMFIDKNEPLKFCADKSADVASHIFFAAEDEYGQSHHDHTTHRELAQRMMRTAVDFYGMSDDDANSFISDMNTDMLNLRQVVSNAYGQNIDSTQCNIEDIMTAIGFHIASELSADREFSVVYEWLEKRHSGLLAKLRGNKSHVWLKAHCSLEIEHFESALDGMHLAIDYIDMDTNRLIEYVLNGVKQFGEVYDRFLTVAITE